MPASAVASSRITTGGSASTIRARATCWACAAVSLWWPSPTTVSRPSGSATTQRSAPTTVSAACRSSSPASGRTRSRSSRKVPLNTCTSWVTTPTRCRSCTGSSSADRSTPPIDTMPVGGREHPAEDGGQGGLAGPALPHHGQRASGRHPYVHAVQHRLTLDVGVRDPGTPPGPPTSAGRAAPRRRDGQVGDPDQSGERRARRLDVVERHQQRAQRSEQPVEQQRRSRHRAHADLVGPDQEEAHRQHRHQPDGLGDVHGRGEPEERPDRGQRRLDRPPRGPFHHSRLPGLHPVRVHGRRPVQDVHHLLGPLAGRHPLLGVQGPGRRQEPAQTEGVHREDEQEGQRQPPVQGGEADEGEHHGDQRGEDPRGHPYGGVDQLDVLGDPGGDVTGAGPLQAAHRSEYVPPAATRSSWEPSSITRPSAMTAIWSHSRAWVSRWATTTAVRPARRARADSSSSRAPAAPASAVASSRITTGGSTRTMRARATCWAWAALSLCSPSPTRCPGRPAAPPPIGRLRPLSARVQSLVSRARPDQEQVLAQVPRNRAPPGSRRPPAAAAAPDRDRPTVYAADRHPTVGGREHAAEDGRRGGLAGPALPHHGQRASSRHPVRPTPCSTGSPST